MILEAYVSKGRRIGPPVNWWQRMGYGWGTIGRVTEEKPNAHGGPRPVEYCIEGEWLTTRQMTGDKRNILRLKQKTLQSRIDRLKAKGFHPKQRGGSKHVQARPPTHKLKWLDLTRPESRGRPLMAAKHLEGASHG
jgi:hypothetical protein